jgi:ATP-dependent Clp protease ATP-binding subunit ClpB
LTDAVRRKPYSVLLFDEMEKAHPDVFNIMLQLLDDGRVTDSKGVHVSFRNTIVIFTSNVGSQDILEFGGSSDPASQEMMKERVSMAMKDKFKPEFLNRLDEQVIFNSLSKDNLRGIVSLEVKRLENRLADRQIKMTLTNNALDFLTDTGFDPVYGARPLKRAIQRELETSAAQGILRGDFTDGDTILVDANVNGLVINKVVDGVVEANHDEIAAPAPAPGFVQQPEDPSSDPEETNYAGSFD